MLLILGSIEVKWVGDGRIRSLLRALDKLTSLNQFDLECQ